MQIRRECLTHGCDVIHPQSIHETGEEALRLMFSTIEPPYGCRLCFCGDYLKMIFVLWLNSLEQIRTT